VRWLSLGQVSPMGQASAPKRRLAGLRRLFPVPSGLEQAERPRAGWSSRPTAQLVTDPQVRAPGDLKAALCAERRRSYSACGCTTVDDAVNKVRSLTVREGRLTAIMSQNAATQVVGEACHVEAYRACCTTSSRSPIPISKALQTLS